MERIKYEKTLIDPLYECYEWLTTGRRQRPRVDASACNAATAAFVHDGLNVKPGAARAVVAGDGSMLVARMSVSSSRLSQEPP
jgi:hypothetical protein